MRKHSLRRFGCARNQKAVRSAPMPLRQTRALHGTVTFRLHTLAKLTDRVSQAAYLADAGLPIGEGRCLSAIGSFRPLSVNDLAAAANLDKGQASRAAQSLVAQGLVLKEASPTDGRGVVLTLTAKGERTWRRVMDLVERRNAEITSCLNRSERAQLDRLLDRLVTHARMAAE
jgi:DNA-binding MarR family transcriptional regulator